eukprot:1144471-Pelagomonas_calceolata.AAC.1
MSELLDLLLAGMDQPQADQLNSPAEGLPVDSLPLISSFTFIFYADTELQSPEAVEPSPWKEKACNTALRQRQTGSCPKENVECTTSTVVKEKVTLSAQTCWAQAR